MEKTETEIYTGYKERNFTDEELNDFYLSQSQFIEELDLKENNYLIVKDLDGSIIDKYCYRNGFLNQIKFPTITNEYCNLIKPRNIYQSLAIDMLQNNSIPVKVLRGVYGSGKDHLMFNEALSQLEHGLYNKIVYIRPNVTVADVPEIGYLKGDLKDKLGWTLAPLADKVGGQDGIDNLLDEGKLEMVPLLFIRGRSFENSIIYVTEGQNMTTEIIKLLISRVGEGSSLWINGDTHQVDKKAYSENNGINTMVQRLKGNKLFSYVYLPLTERGEVANLANLLDD